MNVKAFLFSGESVPVNGVGVIHQPTTEMMLMTDLKLDKFLTPFCVSVDMLDIPDDQKTHFKNFDLLFLQHFQKDPNMKDMTLLEMLENCLKVLMKTNHVHIEMDEMCITINGSGRVTRDNFDDLTDVVLKIFHREVAKFEKKPKLSPKQQEIMDKLNKRRQAKAKKNEIKIEDMLNVVIHGGNFIPYGVAIKFTYWQLVNTYTSIITIDGYKEFLAYKTSGQFEIKDQVDHWIKQLKLK